MVSHLSSENLAITRRKGASGHYFLSKVICFDRYCTGTVGWKRKQKKRRFKGYKNSSRPNITTNRQQLITEDTASVQEVESLHEEANDQIEFGKPISFKKATFQVNSFKLKIEFQKELDGFAEFLLSNPNVFVIIIGHTDDVGTVESNQALSEDRARAVLDYLVSKGVDRSRLNAQGEGDSDPINDGSSEINRAENRRVEFELGEDW